jgi:DNA-binding NarL/FixJ family response regulator
VKRERLSAAVCLNPLKATNGANVMNTEAKESDGIEDARPSLLIVDDEPVMRSALQSQLKSGFRIIALAADATEAIALAEQHRPDAAVIDVNMPDGGARKAVPAIATRSPETCIVILSADESREVVLELLGAGALVYVRKGVTGKELSKTLTDALRLKAAQG